MALCKADFDVLNHLGMTHECNLLCLAMLCSQNLKSKTVKCYYVIRIFLKLQHGWSRDLTEH